MASTPGNNTRRRRGSGGHPVPDMGTVAETGNKRRGEVSGREEGEQAMLSLCTFILVTACILHLAHNTLKWAMFHNAPNAFKLERRFGTFG